MTNLILFALCNCTLLLVLYKWNWISKYELRRPKWTPLWCELCFFFWISMIEYISFNLDEDLSLYLGASIVVHALAATFLSLVFNLLYEVIKRGRS